MGGGINENITFLKSSRFLRKGEVIKNSWEIGIFRRQMARKFAGNHLGIDFLALQKKKKENEHKKF